VVALTKRAGPVCKHRLLVYFSKISSKGRGTAVSGITQKPKKATRQSDLKGKNYNYNYYSYYYNKNKNNDNNNNNKFDVMKTWQPRCCGTRKLFFQVRAAITK
jgi:hypothetical protein